MHKLFLAMVAFALLAGPQSSSACLNDSVTNQSELYVIRLYHELTLAGQHSSGPSDAVITAVGMLLLVGGTVRMMRPPKRKRRAPSRIQSSPQARTHSAGQRSATRSAGQPGLGSGNTRSS
jgi:hypothetical protein